MKTKLRILSGLLALALAGFTVQHLGAQTKGAAAASTTPKAKATLTTVTTAAVDAPRTFPTEVSPDKLLPVTTCSVIRDFFAPENNPRYYIGFPFRIQPGQVVSFCIWKDGQWQEHTKYDNSQGVAAVDFVWKWYAPDSIGQYYYTYLVRAYLN